MFKFMEQTRQSTSEADVNSLEEENEDRKTKGEKEIQ